MQNRFILLLFSVFICLIFNACEEEESPIRFSEETNTNPANIDIQYYSVDPLHQPKEYDITAKYKEGELVLKCDNQTNIYISPLEGQTGSETTLVNNEYGWKAEIIGNIFLKFTFEPMPLEPGPIDVSAYTRLKICAKTKKGIVSTYFTIYRYLTSE